MRGSERLSALALLLLSASVALARPAGSAPRLALVAALLAAVALAARAAPRAGAARLVRDFLPVGVIVAVFSMLQPVIEALNPRRWDPVFAAADERWLGALVTAWRGALGRPDALTDAIYLVYLSFYLLPVAVAAVARRRGPDAYEGVAFGILLCFYLSFLGYFLWPTAGPRLPEGLEAPRLGGGALSDVARAFLRSAEATTLDAFPSGHTAVALVSAALGTRCAPRAGPALWAWAAAIVFATVYVHVHYAVDVLAGGALAALVLLASPRLSRTLSSPDRAALGAG